MIMMMMISRRRAAELTEAAQQATVIATDACNLIGAFCSCSGLLAAAPVAVLVAEHIHTL